MRLCDSSVWVALALSDHLHHADCQRWLDTVQEPASVLFCRATQKGMLRLLTTAALMAPYGNPPLTNQQAWDVFAAFLADERITLQGQEPSGLETYWKQFAVIGTSSPKLWMDAYLAGFARAGGFQMVTTDKAYRQFSGLGLLVLGS